MPYDPAAAHGVTLEISDGASSPVFTEIPGIISGPGGGGNTHETLTAFPHSATTEIRKTSKVIPAPISFDILYDSTIANHLKLEDANNSKAVLDFKMTLKDQGGQVLTFSAQVTGWTHSNDPEDWTRVSVELNPTTGYTRANTPA